MGLMPEHWESPKKILVILAHPDDPEFFCGATIARWTRAGHEVRYCLLTSGDKGGRDDGTTSVQLAMLREEEQRKAAAVLGVQEIEYLRHPDGYLFPDLNLRREVVRSIRKHRPDVVIGCDPTNLFVRESYINHPDHRAAGQVVVDAIMPAAGNHLFFPELREEGFEPHSITELWLSLTAEPDIEIDVTDEWQSKIAALHEHRSQIGDTEEFDRRMLSRRTPDSTDEAPRFVERFRRFKFG